MRWQGRRESDNVEDRRNSSSPMMGGRGFRLPAGKGGLVLLVVVVVASYYGVDLTGLLTGGAPVSQQASRSISPNDDEAAKFTSVILGTTEESGASNSRKWAVPIRSRNLSCTAVPPARGAALASR